MARENKKWRAVNGGVIRLFKRMVILVVWMSYVPAARGAGEGTMSPNDVGIDFSCAGYAAGGALPDVAAVTTVRPSGGDDTLLLQGALDAVGAMPVGAPPGGKNEAFRETATRDFGKSMDFPPATTPRQVYRQVREYHDRYPDKAIVAWNGGVGPIPVLMAGGAQSLSRNPTGGHGQGGKIDRTTLDGFVQSHLGAVLMKMNPRDGLLADAENAWALTDEAIDNVLVYSLAGKEISVTQTLGKVYNGVWFDPRTGKTRACDGLVSLRATATITKPSAEEWMLYLTAAR